MCRREPEFAVRIRDDSLEPVLHGGSVAYLNHDPLHAGDVGIFCVGGDMLCKQYYRDPLGVSYLFSLGAGPQRGRRLRPRERKALYLLRTRDLRSSCAAARYGPVSGKRRILRGKRLESFTNSAYNIGLEINKKKEAYFL